jgi:phosphatidylinositol alpha-1,6-mannosyltransferase
LKNTLTLVGGSAYSSTGGIQTMNRVMTRELADAGWLRESLFLWDRRADTEQTGLAVQGYGEARQPFVRAIVRKAGLGGRGAWLCTHINYAPLVLAACAVRRRPVGLIAHAAELDEGMTETKRRALGRVSRVFAVSAYTAAKVRALGRVRPTVVMPNGVDDPCPAGPPVRPANLPVRVLFVGRMDEVYKGQAELIDAVAVLRNRCPDLRLVFVGGSPAVERWRSEAAARGVGDRVEFTGRVSDAELDRQFRQATIFAMPSQNEGFGLVYAQAMAYGLPCIGSERDAAGEVIAPGKTGLCVPVKNVPALAAAIDTLAKSPDLRAAMGQAGRARFEAQFTEGRYRERFLAVIGHWLRGEGVQAE